jgi:hypothetical protein
MNQRRYRAAAAASLVAALALPALAGEPSPYQPLAFLIGHCWKGTFPDSHTTDEHCFSWVYGGKFVRDEHVVHRGGARADDHGESIYLWDETARRLEYLYIESGGGYSRGTVSAEGEALVFPSTDYTEGGTRQTYRSRWHIAAADAYDVLTEFQVNGQWVPGFTLHMQRQSDARR